MSTAQQYNVLDTITVVIDTNLDAKERFFVTLETTGDRIVNLAANAAAPVFILMEGVDGSTTAGIGTVAMVGRVPVELGGTVTAGAKLTSDSAGKAVATTTDTDHYGGIALEDGVSGDIITMLIAPGMVAG
ncbi:MAG: hypothetical protein V3T43_06085 [Nitrosomonadaceae bacterium]